MVTGLPPGASFTAGAGNTSGQLTWTPSFTQAGSYPVTFTASNALASSTTTVLSIANNDRSPVVSAPATAAGSENSLLTIDVTASDPDGDAIGSISASGLPAGATFTPGPENASGQLRWTPSFTQAGSLVVTFLASNAKSGSSATTITIANVDRPPVANAPAALGVRPGFPLIFQVTAADPDGDAITSLTVQPLPLGASFTPNGSQTSGTFRWTPTLADQGDYSFTFTASNAMSGAAITAVTVSLAADQNPIVVAPATATVKANALLTFGVTATDPDGNAINSLTAAPLPAGATFTPSPGNTAGTFRWTPTSAQQGSYSVSFTASNLLVGWATTSITVRPPNQLPVAVWTVTPATGNAPLLVTADASGSSDADGGIASYNFNFGDGTVTGPQAASSATHSYAAGTWTASLTVKDVDGASVTITKKIIVAPVGSGTNLVTNPSFETNTSGWIPFDLAALTRVAGGFDGGWALQISTTRNQTFGADDSPNTVASTGAAGTRYRCQAWVRAVSAVGDVRLRVREYQGATRLATGNSPTLVLSPTWQMLTLDYLALGSGHSLDVDILDVPHGSSGPFLLDNLSVRIATGPAPAMAEGQGAADPGSVEEESAAADPLARMAPLEAVLSPSPLRSRSTLAFRTTQAGPLTVLLFDLSGRRVCTLLDDRSAAAGAHRLPVDGRGDRGQPLSPGMYFYRVRGVEGASSGRFVIAR